MSISAEIQRLQQAKSDLATSITNKGVTVPASATLDEYPALVDSIQTGGGSINLSDEIQNYTYAITPRGGYNASYIAMCNIVSGKTYKIIMKSNRVSTGTLLLCAYQGNANTPNISMGSITANSKFAEFTYTHTPSANYTRIGIYASASGDRNADCNCVVYIKEI